LEEFLGNLETRSARRRPGAPREKWGKEE